MAKAEMEELETRLLTEANFQRYGLDFRHYAPTSLMRVWLYK